MKPIPKVSFVNVVLRSKSILRNPLPFHRHNFSRFGDVFAVQLGFKSSVIFTRDPGFAKHMLQKNHRKYHKSDLQTKDLGKYLGKGLLTANGPHWLKQRRLIQPAFHKKKLVALVDSINVAILQEVESIQPNTAADVFPVMSDLAFQVVAKALFSYTDTGTTIARLQEITEAIQESFIKEIRQPYKRWWFRVNGMLKHTHDLATEARTILATIIEERRTSGKRADDLLDMLLEARYEDGTGMETTQLIDEILILFTAGHETTSNALSFALLLIAQHPEIQDKVYQEAIAVTHSNVDLLAQIQALPYTKQCIEEAMRLYPPAYFSDRVTIEDDAYDGFALPKGTDILISFYEIHRHEDYWEQPETFNPDRFDPNLKKEFSECYFPFGAGPRMCIGNNFAMYEMILAIRTIVERYTISTPLTTIPIKPLVTLKPDKAVLKCVPR